MLNGNFLNNRIDISTLGRYTRDMISIRYTDMVSEKVIGEVEETSQKRANYAYNYARKTATRPIKIEMISGGRVVKTHIHIPQD